MSAGSVRKLAGALVIATLIVSAWAVGTAAAAEPFMLASVFPLTPGLTISELWPLSSGVQDCGITAIVGSVLIALGSSFRRAAM